MKSIKKGLIVMVLFMAASFSTDAQVPADKGGVAKTCVSG